MTYHGHLTQFSMFSFTYVSVHCLLMTVVSNTISTLYLRGVGIRNFTKLQYLWYNGLFIALSKSKVNKYIATIFSNQIFNKHKAFTVCHKIHLVYDLFGNSGISKELRGKYLTSVYTL